MSRNLFVFLLSVLLVTTVSGAVLATPIIVNVDSRVSGDIIFGFPSVNVNLDVGTWLLSPTNPTVDSSAIYWAWSPWSNGAAWTTRVQVRSSIFSEGIGLFSWESTSVAAFNNSGNVPITVTLNNPDTLKFYVSDWHLGDNIGGVSIRIDELTTSVPEPPAMLLACLGLIGLTVVRWKCNS